MFTKSISAAILAAVFAAPALAVDTGTTAAPSYAVAQAAIDAGDYAGAITTLNALISADPNNADAWNLLGFASRKLTYFGDAANAYYKALSLNPDHLGALEYQGELFIQTGQPEKARANLVRLEKLCGDCEEHEDLAAALAKVGA